MRWKSEIALRELIEDRTQELASEMMKLPDGASEPPEEMLTAMIELEDLRSEFEFLRDNRPGSGEPDALVCAPLNPVPSLNSGTIALPEQDEPQH
jgi:hypothetical protein